MVELGSGPALVLVPGLPGPWQYVRPAVEALASSFRVLTFSLGPDCSIERDAARIAAALDERRIDRAVVCGISFGGLIALHFAATHPDRTRALVLASTPGPGTRLRPRHRTYARWPYVFGPLFVIETPFRLRREIAKALPQRSDRWAFQWAQLKTFLTAGVSLPEIARRALRIEEVDIAADCRRVTAPTLVVTGEAELDWVVPVSDTAAYVTEIGGARHVLLEGTGHLGTITQPRLLATAIERFLNDAESRRHEVA
jgi:3-oxoadipate enol-lactonase